MTLVSPLSSLAPPASGAELVDRHWAVTTLPPARRHVVLDRARLAQPLDDVTEGATHATAYEYAALVGRDALRSGAGGPGPALEREALRVGAERAALLRGALGVAGSGPAPEPVLRDAARLVALGAVAGAAMLADVRRLLAAPPARELLERAEESVGDGDEPAAEAGRLWALWRRLLVLPSPDELAHLVAQLAALRERQVGDAPRAAAPPADDDELRARFRREALRRLGDAAGVLTLALRDRGEADALARELSAHCAAARAGVPGAQGLVVTATWLELGALATLRRRREAGLATP